MIKKYLTPKSIAEAVALKAEHKDDAFFLAGGTKANAAPTRITKPIAISLAGVGANELKRDGSQLTIGAGINLQALLDNELCPAPIAEALTFIYSRNIRNQATLGGEIAAKQDERRIIPTLLAMQAQLSVFDNGEEQTVTLEDYLIGENDALITSITLPDVEINCAQSQTVRSAGGLRVLTAAVSLPAQSDTPIIAIDGMGPSPMRLRDVEPLKLEGEQLEAAVAEAIQPVADLCGSVEYKRYISGVAIADLLVQCQQQEAK